MATNSDAHNYLRHGSGVGAKIELWDLVRLSPVLKQLSREWFVAEEVTLRLNAKKLFWEGSKTEQTLVYAAAQAKALVKLPGISDMRIFAQNVRLGLGNTRVNDEIVEYVAARFAGKTSASVMAANRSFRSMRIETNSQTI